MPWEAGVESNRRLALGVGVFLAASLLALAVAILTLTAESGLFAQHYRLEAHFDNVQGLLAGAPVWLAGKEVGRVKDVRFGAADAERPILVALQIKEEVQPRIRDDSVASIGTIGVLGDSYIELSVGGAEARVLEDGDEIASETPASLARAIATGTRALDNITELTENLNRAISGFSEDRGGEKAAGAVSAVSDILIEIQDGDGVLHSLIYDDYDGDAVGSVGRSLESLEDVLETVREGDGLIHNLVYQRAPDAESFGELLDAGSRLNRILTKMDEGQGTLGLLLNDPRLYEDMRTLLTGAQRSTVLRTLIRLATDAEEDDSKE